MEYKVNVATRPSANGDIVQDLYLVRDGCAELMMRNVIWVQEQQTRDTLIALGWAPPPNDCKVGAEHKVMSCFEQATETEMIDDMVSRFLSWKLPKGFQPDGGVVFIGAVGNVDAYVYDQPGRWPVGTNLFSADQAREMIINLLGDTLKGAWKKLVDDNVRLNAAACLNIGMDNHLTLIRREKRISELEQLINERDDAIRLLRTQLEMAMRQIVMEFSHDDVPEFRQGFSNHECLEMVTAERCNALVANITAKIMQIRELRSENEALEAALGKLVEDAQEALIKPVKRVPDGGANHD